jgi:hypothetical protein
MRSATHILLLVLSASALAVACGGGSGPPLPPVRPVPLSDLVFRTDRLGIADSVRIVVRDDAAWGDVWSRATAGEPNVSLDRRIDFTREMVLVAAAGRMDTGSQIQIDSVGHRGEDFVAVVRTLEECGFQSDAYPVVIVRVARTERPVRWEERRVRSDRCR